MRLSESIVVAAEPQIVWDYIAEPSNALHYMAGITRWEVEGETRAGLGARYRMLMRVGSAHGAAAVRPGSVQVLSAAKSRRIQAAPPPGHLRREPAPQEKAR